MTTNHMNTRLDTTPEKSIPKAFQILGHYFFVSVITLVKPSQNLETKLITYIFKLESLVQKINRFH